MRRFLAIPILVLAALVGIAPPADAHFMRAGQVTTDGFRGECFVEAVYGSFGNGFAQIEFRTGEAGSCALSTTVEVTTAYQGGVRGQSCSMASAIDFPSPNCILQIGPTFFLRAVAPGEAFSMKTIIRTIDGRQSTETHGAFG